MIAPKIESEIFEILRRIPQDRQELVLEFARRIAAEKREVVTSGASLIRFAGSIRADDLAVMKREIELGCERIDVDQW